MGETEQRPTAGSRLGAQENAGISTLEHGQKPPMTPPGKLISIKIQMLDDTQETFDVPLTHQVMHQRLSRHKAEDKLAQGGAAVDEEAVRERF